MGNAKACANKYSGYSVFDENGTKIYPVTSSQNTNLDEIARQVIEGKWGNGNECKSALIKSGYNYNDVQAKVNALLSGQSSPSLKSIDEVAREVINGYWGNGQDRKNQLTQVGYDYHHVQQKVNELLH